jgi:18S rRNA (guanine1575-N7)-methyltransferase
MAAPEARSAGPEAHYAADAQRYAACRVTQRVQQELTARALELLGPPAAQPLLLDLGCGSGNGHDLLAAAGWGVLGCDISADMLQQPAPTPAAAAFDRVRLDMGQGLPLRREVLPAAISISAVQWVCKAGPGPMRRLLTSLHACLQPGARAVLQLYPQTRQQVAELLEACHVSGLQAVFLMDLPHQTAAGKFFLVLHKPNTAAGEVHSKLCKALLHITACSPPCTDRTSSN